MELLLKYISDPNNLLQYVPAFKGLKQIDNNTWELEVKWLFTLKLTVKKERINYNEIEYITQKVNGLVKISSYLRFLILTSGDENILRIIFSYEGPFESVVKKQTDEFYRRGKEVFEKDIHNFKKVKSNS